MRGKMDLLGSTVVLGSLVLSACSQPPASGAGLANPASVYCEEQGYTLEMRTGDAGVYGVCIFPDGSACEEWAFFRGECGPGSTSDGGEEAVTPNPAATDDATGGGGGGGGPALGTSGGLPVVGWLGAVVSTPADAQFDDYVVLMPEGAGEVGIEGADASVEAQIVALRDREEPGKYAHFWGTLTCDVPDYGGCQLLVARVRVGTEVAEPEPVEAWEGVIVSNPAGSQFDDYFVLAGGFPVGYGIGSIDPAIREQLAALRDTGITARVWGQLRAGVPDAFGSQIDVTRVEGIGDTLVSTPEAGAAVDGWEGTVVKLPPGSQFGQYFLRDDGERFDIGASDTSLQTQINEAAWTGAHIRVWGGLFTGVPAMEARYIDVERLEFVGGPAAELRNLSPFATPSVSSALPSDRGGTYFAWAAIDGLPESSWVEGAAGSGAGEWVMLTFPEAIEVHRIGIDVGFDRDGDIFAKNNRLRRATVYFSNGESIELSFLDERGVQMIGIDPVETTYVKIVIEEVYPGTHYDDTCLAEIEVWGKVK
jgi:putative hemolysin